MWINLLYIYILKVKCCSIFDFLILYRGGIILCRYIWYWDWCFICVLKLIFVKFCVIIYYVLDDEMLLKVSFIFNNCIDMYIIIGFL